MISGTGSAARCRKKMIWVISAISCITLPAVHSVAAAPGPDSNASPEELYRRGAEAYRGARYEEAIELIGRANRLEPHAELWFDLGRAYESAGDLAHAAQAFREYLRLLPGANDRVAIETRIDDIERRLRATRTSVTIASRPEQATLRVDGVVMGATPWKGVLAPGAHHVVLQRSGYEDAARDVLVVSGQKLVVDLPLDAASSAVMAPPESPEGEGVLQKVRLPTWIALGVGAASLGTAVGFQIAAQSAEDDARNSTTQLEHQSLYATAETNRDVARVLFGVGAAAMVAGATLFTIDVTRRSPVRVGFGPGHASVQGAF
jgi:tetratricopeptide (TPR) repeat protein